MSYRTLPSLRAPMTDLEDRLQRVKMQRRRLVESNRTWVNVDAASLRIDLLWAEEQRLTALVKQESLLAKETEARVELVA